MKKLKTVGIKELKNNLSTYVREVRSGTTVLVSDRNTIVAEMHQPYHRTAMGETVNPLLMEWAEAGLVSLPAYTKVPLTASPVKLRAGTSAELIRSDRKERHE